MPRGHRTAAIPESGRNTQVGLLCLLFTANKRLLWFGFEMSKLNILSVFQQWASSAQEFLSSRAERQEIVYTTLDSSSQIATIFHDKMGFARHFFLRKPPGGE